MIYNGIPVAMHCVNITDFRSRMMRNGCIIIGSRKSRIYPILCVKNILRRPGRTAALVLGSVVAGLACYFFHFVSGALFYGAWAEWFFTDTVLKDLAVSKWIMENLTGGGLAAVYSAVYNGCYMIPEIVITAVIAIPVSRIPPVRKY